MKHFICIAISVLYGTAMWSQEIYTTLNNPSFEGPIQEAPPPDWHNCMNSPDTGPYWFPNSLAFDGNTYLQVVSYTANWEEIVSQKLQRGLQANHNYYFSIYLAADSTEFPFLYGKIGFWLGQDTCSKSQMIFTSPVLDSIWTKYVISFTPDMDYDYLIISSQSGTNPNGGYYTRADLISPIYEGYPTSVSMPNTTNKEITMYPNPSEGLFSINMPSSDMARHINVYDNLGRLIKSMDIAAHTKSVDIDLSNYAQGLFFINITEHEQSIYSSKVSIVK